jgi:hypothetical protein
MKEERPKKKHSWPTLTGQPIKLCGVANIPNKSQTGSVENKIHKLSLLTAADVCTNIRTYKREEVKVILFLSTT